MSAPPCESCAPAFARLRRRSDRERRAREEAEAIAEATSRQALHDPLTELPNRTLLADRLGLALDRAQRLGTQLALLFLDLDGFKAVNDSLGHAAGDELLTVVAGRLRGCIRTADTAARLGGDEFAVLLEDVTCAEEAEAAAARILAAVTEPMTVGGRTLVVGTSVGIALGDGTREDVGALLRNADLAMYQAKAAGKGRSHIFEPHLHAAALARLEAEEQLRRALEAEEFVLHYQPIVHLDDGRPSRVEALVRWRRDGALTGPAGFIPIAEETGLIVELGDWVLRRACTDVAALNLARPGDDPIGVAVNVSPRQLGPDLPARVGAALADAGLPPSLLTIELTENALMGDEEGAPAHLLALKALGVRVSLDDFGTGYASLGRLRRLPVDQLKVDRSFVAELGSNDQPLLPVLVYLARVLGVETVAEGVEDVGQLRYLRALGCDAVQGFLFGRPVPAVELPAALQAAEASGRPPRSVGAIAGDAAASPLDAALAGGA
jgi:diguanylate cyclase (GGDEF)-like protein